MKRTANAVKAPSTGALVLELLADFRRRPWAWEGEEWLRGQAAEELLAREVAVAVTALLAAQPGGEDRSR